MKRLFENLQGQMRTKRNTKSEQRCYQIHSLISSYLADLVSEHLAVALLLDCDTISIRSVNCLSWIFFLNISRKTTMKSSLYLLLPVATTVVNLMFVVAVMTYFPHQAAAMSDSLLLEH